MGVLLGGRSLLFFYYTSIACATNYLYVCLFPCEIFYSHNLPFCEEPARATNGGKESEIKLDELLTFFLVLLCCL